MRRDRATTLRPARGAAAWIRIADAAALRLLCAQAAAQPILSGRHALPDYLQADMAQLGLERVRVLHLNTRDMLIRDGTISEGSIDRAAMHMGAVIRRSIELGSASIIPVHNHPSGDPSPSRQGIALTRQIIDTGGTMGVIVHDHVIIGARGHPRLRTLGLA